jgi:DNA-binding winged helix-turn-helix (wHTH) protein
MMDENTASAEPAPTPASERFYRLGNIIVDQDTRLLLREGEVVRLEPRVFALLTHLASNAGREISRQELGVQVWHGANVVDEAIQRAVSLLRAALGDSPKQALYIQTTASGGYRLTCDVAVVRSPRVAPPVNRQLVAAGGAGLLVGLLAATWSASLTSTPTPTAPEAPIARMSEMSSEPTPAPSAP